MKRLGLLLVLASLPAFGQGLAPAPPVGSRMTPYAAGREDAIAPALDAMNKADWANALALFEAVLPQYPQDARVLMLAGRSAHLASDDAKALSFYKSALTHEPPAHPQWQLHVEIVPLYAAAADWQNFDRERLLIREAAVANAPFFANLQRYAIETIHNGDTTIQVYEYPRLYGRFHTRYRFSFPLASATSTWRPYIDCESDDMDQVSFAKSHPELAAMGVRSFSLDAYMAANSHGTIKLFGDGEPTYQAVRELVAKSTPPIAVTTRQ